MSNLDIAPSEREQIEMLLPWYVTGKLDPAERAQVKAYLDRHPEMVAQLELIREEQAAAVTASEAVTAPPARAFDKLLDEIDAESRLTPRLLVQGMVSGIFDFFRTPTATGVRWAAVAAAVVVMVQAVAIGSLMTTNRSGGTFQSASGQTGTLDGSFALVRFNDAARASDIAIALADLNMIIVDGPKPGNLFRVRLSAKKLDEVGRTALVAEARARAEVFALVLPVN